jgi:ABC-2 type transport system permease protein
MKKIRTILLKEWAEVFKNRMIIFTVAFVPLIMTVIPLAIIASTREASQAVGESMGSSLPADMKLGTCPQGMSGVECFQVFLVNEFMLMFMIIPVIIPVTMAAYSVVGEKTTRSLEPLLATPITTAELLLGKCLAAAIPAVLATYAAFGLFALGSWLMVRSQLLLGALLDARWLIAIFIVGPLLAVMAVTFALMVSSRTTDPRVAEQISMAVIVPVLVGFFGQVAGLFVLTRIVISWVAVVMLGVDVLLVYLATRLFQRESILTRWK